MIVFDTDLKYWGRNGIDVVCSCQYLAQCYALDRLIFQFLVLCPGNRE